MVIVHPHVSNETTEPKAVSSISIAQIDEALTRFVLQDTVRQDPDEPVRYDGSTAPESVTQTATDINSLIQRVAGVSLDQLDDVIVDLRHLRDFVHSEGRRIQEELSGFVKLNRATMDAANLIAENMRSWKETRPRSPDATNVRPAPGSSPG